MMRRATSLCAAALVAVVGVLAAADHTTDTLDAVKANVAAKKAVIVDVREAAEWADGHLTGAKHLPLSELRAGVPADKLKAALPPGTIV
jgi:phage shock protein E